MIKVRISFPDSPVLQVGLMGFPPLDTLFPIPDALLAVIPAKMQKPLAKAKGFVSPRRLELRTR